MRTNQLSYGISLLAILSACNGVEDVNTLKSVSKSSSESASQSSSTSPQSNASATTVAMTQRYLYIMADGGVMTIPIDSLTGEPIQVVTGNWWVKPLAGTGNFYTMTMNPNGKVLYALLRNTSIQSKIYQYAVADVAYSLYGTDRPLTELATKPATNVSPGLFSWGNNGNLFIQNYNYSPTRVDTYTINPTTSLLSSPTVVGSQTTASNTYALTFDRITQVGYDNHTYTIDSQTNRIIHYIDGVIQSSFNATQFTMTDIAIH